LIPHGGFYLCDILSIMRKLLIPAAAFTIAAVAGVILLAVGSILVALPQIAGAHASGIGAVAGGISEAAVLLVPILCGILGVVLTLHRLNRHKV
jgi:fatty-acid desaturase